jgi:hypothetical protein
MPLEPRKVFVGGIPRSGVKPDDLKAHFARYCGHDEHGHRPLPRLRLRRVRRRRRGAGLQGEGGARLRRPQGEFILANNGLALAAAIFFLFASGCYDGS